MARAGNRLRSRVMVTLVALDFAVRMLTRQRNVPV